MGDKIVTQTAGGDIVGRDKITTIITDDKSYDVAGLPNPYLGLRNFTYADRRRYAGRESGIAEAVAKLTEPGERERLLFVTGASGSGKSSFAQAGILPALEDHYAQRWLPMQHASLRPGRHPWAALQDALLILPARATDPSPQPKRVLIIDQFEELFTQSEAAERDSLFGWLAELPGHADGPEHVICTLRSDYLNELFNVGPLWDIAKRGVELRAMRSDELKVAMLRPLQSEYPHGEKRMEPALADRLAADAAGQASYLPLLQVTLEELWNKGRLSLSSYGTLTDAIKQRANVVYDFVDHNSATPRQHRSPAEQAAILELCLSLVSVSPDDDPRRDVRIGRATAELAAEQRQLAADLSQARLLSIDIAGSVETVNIIHETLISNWDRLREAVQARRHQLRERGRFEQQLQMWLANDRSDDYLLLTHVQLEEARQLDAAADIALRSPKAQELLQRSLGRAEQERQRELEEARQLANSERQRAEQQMQANRRLRGRNLVISVVGALALVAAIIAGFLGVQANQSAVAANRSRATAQAAATLADQARATAVGAEQLARARLLVTQGQSLYAADPVLGVRLALEALALQPDGDTTARGAIVEAVRSLLSAGRLYRLGDDVRHLYPAPEHNFMVVARANSPDELRRTTDGNWHVALTGKVSGVTYSPDAGSSYVLIAYSDAPGELRRTSDGSLVGRLAGMVGMANNTFFGVQFSPGDARSVVINYLDAPAELRRSADGAILARLDAAAIVEFSPDTNGQDLAVGKLHYNTAGDQYSGLDVTLYRTADGAQLAALPGPVNQDGPNSIGLIFSQDPGASAFVALYVNTPSELRRTADGQHLATLAGTADAVTFSPTPNPGYFVASYFAQPAELRRATDGSVVTSLGLNLRANFSPDGAYLVVGPAGQPGELRRSIDGAIIAQLTNEIDWSNHDLHIIFSPPSPNALVFIRYKKGSPELRRLRDGSAVPVTASPQDVMFSPDVASTYFYVSYGAFEQPADEVRRMADGAFVARLPVGVQFSTFISTTQGIYLALQYRSARQLDELRRASDGTLVATLAGKLIPDGLTTNAGSDNAEFVAAYSDAPAEIRHTADGRATVLSGHMQTASSQATFSPQPDAHFILLSYDDGTSEIWTTHPLPHMLVHLGRGLADGYFEMNSRRMVVRYSDGQSFALSLDLLDALDGNPAALAPAMLTQIACRILFAPAQFDETQLTALLDGHPALACH